MKNFVFFRLIKLFDIGLIGVYYFLFGFIASMLLDKANNNFLNMNDSNILIILSKILINIFLIMIIVFYIRFIIKRIPFIFDKMYGFNHNLVKELNGGVIIAFALFFSQNNFKNYLSKLNTIFIL